MAILLPVTYGLSPVTAVILLAGILYGAQYGGSTTSILVNIPGEVTTIVTCLDGYPMAKRGRAGPALGMARSASFIGTTFGTIALMVLVFPLANQAVKFGPVEYFSLICMSMTILIYLVRGSVMKAAIMVLVGLLLSTVGIDLVSGVARFAFRAPSLLEGIGLAPMAMGLFGISEILMNLEEAGDRVIYRKTIKNLLPNLRDWKRSFGPIWRGSFIGFILGILPGAGPIISTFLSYSIEKRISKHPEEFGKGAIEGVAGPEAAHNASVGGSFVPLLALGIPSNVAMGVFLGALMIHDVLPGPLLITQHPEIFWGVIASMYLGNVMCPMLNLPLIGIWVKMLEVPNRILVPLILLFCLIGAYSINNSVVDVIILVVFGLFGYILRKLDYDVAPLALAFVLGPILETALRRSLIMSKGKISIFIERPISGAALLVTVLLLIASGISTYRKTRTKLIGDIEA